MKKFPSPCGDKLKCVCRKDLNKWGDTFPSPCGDKLKYYQDIIHEITSRVSVPLRG